MKGGGAGKGISEGMAKTSVQGHKRPRNSVRAKQEEGRGGVRRGWGVLCLVVVVTFWAGEGSSSSSNENCHSKGLLLRPSVYVLGWGIV